MLEDGPETKKIPRIKALNELEYVKFKYDEAMQKYIEHPTYENKKAFLEANEVYINTRYAYAKGLDLLIEFYARFRGISWVYRRKYISYNENQTIQKEIHNVRKIEDHTEESRVSTPSRTRSWWCRHDHRDRRHQ